MLDIYNQEFVELWKIEEAILIHQGKNEDYEFFDGSYKELHELVMNREEKINFIIKHVIG